MRRFRGTVMGLGLLGAVFSLGACDGLMEGEDPDVEQVVRALGGVFQQTSGQVVVEAENFTATLSQGGRSWTRKTDAAASGGAQLQATPDSGANVQTGYTTGSPRLNFDVNFTSTGTHHVWIRGRAGGTTVANSDSLHVGINGVGRTSAAGVAGFTASYVWIKAPVTITVPSTGRHTFNVWMREDGFVIDKILLTTNANLATPTGTGPAESGNVATASCFDQIQNGAETGIDCGGATCGACSSFGVDLPRPSNTTCLAGDAPATGLQRLWSNITFNQPIGLVQEPGTRAFYVIEKAGTISRVGTSSKTAFLTLNVETGGEGGVWSMAFHPNYPTNRSVYVSYSPKLGKDASGKQLYRMQISRFTTTSNSGVTTIVAGSEVVLWSIAKSQSPFATPPATGIIHNGGSLQFGPDGMLYMGVGDDRLNRAQASNPASAYGSVIRLDVNATAPYIPASGNLNGVVWAYGFRNPWRIGFDRQTGELWVADVGEDSFEEVDIVQAGKNYGWPHWEADSCSSAYMAPPSSPVRGDCTKPNTTPEFKYAHSGAMSVTGGYVYRGSAMPSLAGKYLYADFERGTVSSYDRTTKTSTQLFAEPKGLAAFAQDLDGELYLLDYQGGRVLKIQPPSGSTTGPKALLSETGCFTAIGNPPVPASGVIPYAVAQPFWSDGAAKERLLALPNNSAFTVANDGDFTLPTGGVLIKHFKMPDGRYFETRFFVRYNNGTHGGYTYQWRSDQSDADLVDASGADARVGVNSWLTQDWRFPSRGECLQCHTSAAGFALGPETRQFNIDNFYPSTGRTANQIDTLVHLGMLPSTMVTDSTKKLAPFPSISNSAIPIATRANAYLHVNCSSCHRPPGSGRAIWNALFDVPLASKQLCNVLPLESFSGNPDERLIKPGSNTLSTVWLRTHQRTANFMPPLGSFLPDQSGADFLATWINQLTSADCPAAPVNLLNNPGFASDLSGWSQVVTFPGEDKILFSSTGGDGMGSCARLYNDGSANAKADLQLYQARSVSSGQSYTLAFDVSTAGTNGRNVTLFMKSDSAPNGTPIATAICAIPGTGVRNCTLTATMPAGTGSTNVRFGIEGGADVNDLTVDNGSVLKN